MVQSTQDTEPTRTATVDGPRHNRRTKEGIRIPEFGAAERLGRFDLLHPIGTGGMGQVYAAYDPKLDRRVALKVLHEARDHSSRLLLEAKALAQLAHPNVVAVHDVEQHQGRVFIAMEYVAGSTLRQWNRANAQRTTQRHIQALDILLQAGQGLAAVHAAGLIHRDFKPSNILIGEDGRARVADFGLVRSVRDTGALVTTRDDTELNGGLERTDDSERSVPPSSAIVGTIPYMAPEQIKGVASSSATDQFAYCVTAWEVLFGSRAFDVDTASAMLSAVRRGATPPESIGAEWAFLERVLRKGLAFQPQRRHASMDVVLTELRRMRERLCGRPHSAPRRWRAALVVTGPLLAAALATVAFTRRLEPCTGAEQAIAAVWNDNVRDDVHAAFVGTETVLAESAWARFEAQIDEYAVRWAHGHTDACEAAQVRKEQSAAVMDARIACLDDRRRSLAALLDVYLEPDPRAVAQSFNAASALRPVDECADLEYVSRRSDVPSQGLAGRQAKRVQDAVASSKALASAGRLSAARDHAVEAVRTAEQLESPTLLARASLQRGVVAAQERDGPSAELALERAFLLASSSPQIRAEASRRMMEVESLLLDRRDAGRTWERLAIADAKRLDNVDFEGTLLLARARLRAKEGNLATAQTLLERAQHIVEPHDAAPPVLRLDVATNLASVLSQRGALDEANKLLATAFDRAEADLGPDHPSMIAVHRVFADLERQNGSLGDALSHAQRAVALGETVLGRNHIALSDSLRTHALVLRDLGNTDGAVALLERARALSTPTLLDAGTRASLLVDQAELQLAASNLRTSYDRFREAVNTAIELHGRAHPTTLRALIGLGTTLARRGARAEATEVVNATRVFVDFVAHQRESPRSAEILHKSAQFWAEVGDDNLALHYAERALHDYEQVVGPRHRSTRTALVNVCSHAIALEKFGAARPHCARALELHRAGLIADPDTAAGIHSNYGALLARDGHWSAARPHYEQALATWTDHHGPTHHQVATALANLAGVEVELDLKDSARAHYKQALAIREAAYGPRHPRILVPLVALSHLAAARGAFGEANKLARRGVTIADAHGSPLQIARAQEALARAQLSQGRSATALERLRSVNSVYEARRGETSRDLARVRGWTREFDIGAEQWRQTDP